MSSRTLSNRFLQTFVESVSSELGPENLSIVLGKAGLSQDRFDPVLLETLNGTTAAEVYARLQKAMRTYFGRGARGILMRVGSDMWGRLLQDAPLAIKAQSKIVFGLPLNARRKPALELLAKLLMDQRRDVTVHILDLDLLLADQASPGTLGQSETERVCYVTLGLVRECLYWATGQEHDIEETSCRANGEDACEFKITIGG